MKIFWGIFGGLAAYSTFSILYYIVLWIVVAGILTIVGKILAGMFELATFALKWGAILYGGYWAIRLLFKIVGFLWPNQVMQPVQYQPSIPGRKRRKNRHHRRRSGPGIPVAS